MDDEKYERAIEALEEQGRGETDPVGGVGPPDHWPFSQCGSGGSEGRTPSISALASLASRAGFVDPVGSLAADLCETAICEAMPPEKIVATARACREAAEICYGPWLGYPARKPQSLTAEEYRREVYGDFPPERPLGESPSARACAEGSIERLGGE